MTNNLRERAAIAAMQGLLAGNAIYGGKTNDRAALANDAVAHADALIDALAERAKRYGEEAIQNGEDIALNYPNDDWIEWHGGECPVDGDTVVEVEFHECLRIKKRARLFDWAVYYKDAGNIIRYRVVGGEYE